MAASMSPSQRQDDFAEEFLTCSICTEPFDDNERQAKCLPCQHSYCKSCLKRHVGKRSRLNCPNCRKVVVLTEGGISNLPNNFLVQNLRDYQDMFNFTMFCGGCDDKSNNVVSFCNECGCFLCHVCIGIHKKLRPLQAHRLSTLAELQKKKANPMMQQQMHCEKHPKQDLNMYCRAAQCKVPICATCGLIDHRGHDLIEQSAAVDEILAEIRTSLTRVEKKRKILVGKRDHVENMKRMLTESFDRTEKEISESEHKLLTLVKCRYGDAKAHLNRLYQNEMKHLRALTESIDLLSAQLSSVCEFTVKACDVSQLKKQLPISHNHIMDQLRELEGAKLPETTSENVGVHLTKRHHSVIADIKESIPHLCTIDWLKHPDKHRDAKGNIRDKAPSHISSICQPSKMVLIISIMVLLLSFLTYHKLRPQIDPGRCTIELGPPCNDHDDNEEWFRTAIIQTVDNYGRFMSTGGANVEAYYKDLNDAIYVQDYYDGAYTFEYDCWETVHVKIKGVELDGSPFDMDSKKEDSINIV